MNKKIVHLLTNKLPIVSVIILLLAYVYLSIPDNYVLQVGGVALANTYKLPKSIPFKYKYRWVFVLVPVLVLIHLIYSIYFVTHLSSLTMWDAGKDFFQQFQLQANAALKALQVSTDDPTAANKLNYESLDPSDPLVKGNPDILKLYNFIQLSGDPRSSLYTATQYFCNSFRPCSCCDEPGYTEFFTTSAPTCADVKSGKRDGIPQSKGSPSRSPSGSVGSISVGSITTRSPS